MRLFWVLFLTIVFTLFFGLIGVLASIFESRRGRIFGYCARIWGKLILFLGGIKYSVKGLENLDLSKTYFFAGNHASGFDILLAFAGIPFWIVSIAKVELKSVPVLGWVMRAGGHFFIDRGCYDKAMGTLKKAKKSLEQNPRSILIFPEGTRTTDGELIPFKGGGLSMSIEMNVPVVPIAFVHTFEMLDKNSWRIHNHPIELRIGMPIPIESYSFEKRRAFASHVQSEVQKLLDRD